MSNKSRGLGRGLQNLGGLGELLSDIKVVQHSPDKLTLVELGVDQIHPNKNQPRKVFDQNTLQEMAQSIKHQGILQPLVVRPSGDNTYELIAGERRWRAAQIAELDTVPAVVRAIDDNTAVALMLVENIQRDNLSPLEQAYALEQLRIEFAMSHQEISEAVGKSRSSVTNFLRLLTLSDDVKRLLEGKKLEMGHAKVLLGFEGKVQSELAWVFVHKQLSVREAENLAKHWKGVKKEQKEAVQDPNVVNLQQDLADRLGAKVNIQHTQKGKGKLVIHYSSLDELDGILGHIN